MENGVVWREGLFLRPQHFQQNDRHFDYEIRVRTREFSANRWGIFDLYFDKEYLTLGKIVLERAYGIMPDGTLFNIAAQTQQLIFDAKEDDAGKILHLALPLSIHRADELSFETNGVKSTRMIAVSENEIPNTNAGENTTCELSLARQNFQILRAEEMNEGYGNIAIVKIASVSSTGAVSLDDSFIPVYLHINACEYLLVKIRELINVINYRMDKLVEKLGDTTVHATELGDYLLLQLLNRFYSRFHHYIHQEKLHPQDLFLELHSLIAELAVFMKKGKRPDKIYEYVHKRQKESFEALFNELRNLLSMVIEQNSVKLDIEERKYGVLVAKIEDKSFITTGAFILSATSNIAPEKLKKLLLDNLKIGTIENIRELVNFQLAGFKLAPLPIAPRQIPYRINYVYFNIELTGDNQKELLNSGGLAFHRSGNEIDGLEYHLWAIRNKKE
ncbi:MAG: type VI secretion system baseplate subunit TssK [Helicobacteraceae bacterium]|jgi:type VI secretion system protein ImpJ|nr:type VI secretion system baseplate subunit TssK [Helicobacteraceae bacterium]